MSSIATDPLQPRPRRVPTAAAVLLGASLAVLACSDSTEPDSATSGAAAGTPSAPATASAPVSQADAAPRPSPLRAGRVDIGCLDEPGTARGNAQDWYRADAEGTVALNGDGRTTDPPAVMPLVDALRSARLGDGAIRSWEYFADESAECAIGRGAEADLGDGEMVRVSVWRVIDAANPSLLPHHAPFTFPRPDLMVSDGSAMGDISVFRVLADGTTIKVVALGVDAFGFAGWPTTAPPRPDQAPPQPPDLGITDVITIADAVAATLGHDD